MLNLALDRWIPVLQNGVVTRVAPWEIVDSRITAVDAAREPWDGALTEFLVALIQTALFPADAREWRAEWDDPPTPAKLRLELEKIASYFELEGKRPFMQDLSLEREKKVKGNPIERLLVGGISDNQLKNRADIFVKHGMVDALCPPCAATALWDIQAHAPQGGRGYFTSARGGGPISTLVLCDTLWKTVWANVVEQSALSMKGRPDPATFLPWATGTSGKVNAADESPLHVYWGMPRRIRLKWTAEDGTCGVCGEQAAQLTRSFLTARGGLQYDEGDWRHPLSPYALYKAQEGGAGEEKKEASWAVRETASDLLGYGRWMGIIVDTPKGDGVPALVIRRWLERAALGEPKFRVWGFGYRTHMASVLSWCEGRVPVPVLSNGRREEYEAFLRTLVALSQYGAEQLTSALKGLRKSEKRRAPNLYAIQDAFWRDTAPLFEEAIQRAVADPSAETLNRETDAWIKVVRRRALALYERRARNDGASLDWVARYAHRLRRVLGFRCPTVLKTRQYGDWRIDGF